VGGTKGGIRGVGMGDQNGGGGGGRSGVGTGWEMGDWRRGREVRERWGGAGGGGEGGRGGFGVGGGLLRGRGEGTRKGGG